MTVLLLAGPGENQRALAHRLHAAVPLAHIAQVAIPPGKMRRRWLRSIVSATLARPLGAAWRRMLGYYAASYPCAPDVPTSLHHGVNSPSVSELVTALRPDVVLVSGTDLLRGPLISAISGHGRIMNLHTGISPYIKGAPNCTNWALSLGEFDLIGNTVMWLDQGIDSGPLVATERTPLTGHESLFGIHHKVMDHAHELFVRAVTAHHAGRELARVAQTELGEGRLFLTRDWTGPAMVRAVLNYYRRYNPANLSARRPLRLIDLPG